MGNFLGLNYQDIFKSQVLFPLLKFQAAENLRKLTILPHHFRRKLTVQSWLATSQVQYNFDKLINLMGHGFYIFK